MKNTLELFLASNFNNLIGTYGSDQMIIALAGLAAQRKAVAG